MCDLLLRSWSLMLHHPWWAYEKIFDQTGDQTFWSIWVSFGESSFKKIRLVSLCAGCPTMFGKLHVFFWDCRRALIFRKPLTSPQEIYLEPSCRVFVAGTGRRDFASWLMHFGYVSNLGVSGTATFSKLELKPQQKPNKF